MSGECLELNDPTVLQLGASPLALWAVGLTWAQINFNLLDFFYP